MKSRNIGILGSAFNPPTLGHLDLIRQAVNELDWVYLVPSFAHAFGKQMADYQLRADMVRAFIADHKLERVSLLLCEHELAGNGPVYTYDVLNWLECQYAYDSLHFIIGPDNAKNWSKFHKAKQIQKRWSVFIGKERQAIRSTYIRQAVSIGEPISSMTSTSVAELIKQHKLYQEETAA
ncbi:nicotinate-nicotinamide nucleotide adenylyltransferase [Pleionea mediterranea]|uniref:nicotinate-nucleotide adenylyltransferase n=1 Tax=Pleionea mediterranea TaxID=523701 RepID=A0A316FQ71_9GAMM|nr:nicotinate-nicotinamide nucleotide adenylyltransferase [Pleionea mediterranea]PWK49866.1 nicotinate-nucleotide adenylyltransferase [Pleionea mediterranea]